MKKIKALFTAAALILAGSSVFAERAPVYISPNNDGVQDALTVPLKIKEKRYVSEWSFTIFNSKGEVVRIIGNKEKREERITFKNFFKQLFTPKQGVDIPSEVTWNGYFDDGSLAPDGKYFYQFSATDDNGNTATTSKLCVIVDNTAPQIDLRNLSLSEKTFGEGSKSSLRIAQSGSKENLWTAVIYDAATKAAVREYKWENAEPVTFDWDGTDETGMLVSDGVYTYEITSTDSAGNKAELSQITNIIYSAEKPAINLTINGSRYFSPNGDGINDVLKLAVSVPEPVSKSNHVVQWSVVVYDEKDNAVRSWSGDAGAPSELTFDGKNDAGAAVTETSGQYYAKVSARYLNGYEPAPVDSPKFVLDNVTPEALVRVSESVFNGSENLEINQKVLNEEADWTGKKNWNAKIIGENGSIVRVFDFGSAIPETVLWNGMDDSGRIASDGSYYYELTGTEPAGNTGVYKSSAFTLDTSKTELMLTASPEYFSPALGKSEVFTLAGKASSGIEKYSLTVADSNGKVVKTFEGNGNLPSTLTWNGNDDSNLRCSDGTYVATLKTTANSGTEATAVSHQFVIDTKAPEVSIEVPYTVFSPDGISSRQKIPVKASSSSETKWTAEIRKSGSAVSSPAVRTFVWQNGKVTDFAWDGTDESGNKAADGTYVLTVSSSDAAGNTGTASISGIKLDVREAKAYITADLTGISPNGDNIKESQKFTVKASLTEGISSWKFGIVDSEGKTVKQWTEKDSADLPSTFIWAGDTDAGLAADGRFHGSLHVEYEKGNVVDADSSEFICTAIAPQLKVQTVTDVSKIYFSPDNDGVDDDLYIRLSRSNKLAELKNWSFTIYDRNHNAFWKTSGKSTITERIIWDGRGNNGELVQSAEDYTYAFEAEDELSMASVVTGVIHVDVLVVRDGNKLKIQVPSIIFRSDNADFLMAGEKDASGHKVTSGISDSQKANNEQILRRVAQILDKFKDYKVTIVGHANRLTDNPDEETVDNPSKWGPALIPLSLKRAEYVRQLLISYGIGADRLSVDGKGGTEPVADTTDKDVNWKNRRVEFILEK